MVKNVCTFAGVTQVIVSGRHFNKKVIVDLDDDIKNVSKDSPVYQQYHEGSEASVATTQLIEDCNHVFVENDTLGKTVNNGTSMLHNYIDRDSLKLFKQRKEDGKIYIGWFGGSTHKRDVENILDTVKYLIDKYDNVHFVIWGGFSIDHSSIPKKRKTVIEGTVDYYDYLKKLGKVKVDIGLAPLVQSKFNESKSPCKFFEYSIAGACTVAIGYKNLPYARVIDNKETGILYNTDKALLFNLEFLINNPEEIKRLRNNARADINENWCIQDHWQEWEKALDKVGL
jgi:glycosyltransferase involved in cell wall biosynthesis